MKKLTIRLWRQNRLWYWELQVREPEWEDPPTIVCGNYAFEFIDAVADAQRNFLKHLAENPQLQED